MRPEATRVGGIGQLSSAQSYQRQQVNSVYLLYWYKVQIPECVAVISAEKKGQMYSCIT
jgi:hypothetical protein